MGFLQAIEMAARLPLRQALRWHLTTNHFPPLPESLMDLAVEAVSEARKVFTDEADGSAVTARFDKLLELPSGLRFRDRSYITIGEAIHTLHLEPFIEVTPAARPHAGERRS